MIELIFYFKLVGFVANLKYANSSSIFLLTYFPKKESLGSIKLAFKESVIR